MELKGFLLINKAFKLDTEEVLMAKDYPWNEVKNEYIVLTSEGKTKVLDILAEKHNIPYNTLNARVQRDGWREYANKLEAKSADKLIDKVTAAKLKHIQIGNELIDIGMKTLRNAGELKNGDAVDAVRLGSTMIKDVLMPANAVSQAPITVVFQAYKDGLISRPKEVNVIDITEVSASPVSQEVSNSTIQDSLTGKFPPEVAPDNYSPFDTQNVVINEMPKNKNADTISEISVSIGVPNKPLTLEEIEAQELKKLGHTHFNGKGAKDKPNYLDFLTDLPRPKDSNG